MALFGALLYYAIIIPLSLLPYAVLYKLSDGLFYVFYYVIGYRKAVVMQNIRNSFPEKTSEEQIDISKKFYRHFCDLILESLKVFTISESEVRERMIIENPEVLDFYFNQKRSVIIAGGHYNNWELFAVALAAPIKHRAIAIYKTLTSQFFDRKMRKTRGQYGLEMISTKIVKEVFEEEKNNLTATVFAIDQSPGLPDKCHWMKFLQQDTAVLFGMERYAKAYNYPVIFGHISKIKRGYYSFRFLSCFDQPKITAPAEITEQLTRLLETEILKEPAYWLWTHKRWKHKRPSGLASPQQFS